MLRLQEGTGFAQVGHPGGSDARLTLSGFPMAEPPQLTGLQLDFENQISSCLPPNPPWLSSAQIKSRLICWALEASAVRPCLPQH